MKNLLGVFGALACVATATALGATDEELAKLVAEDVSKPVRPVGANGQTEFWNVNATWFLYPPVIAFPEKKGCGGYRIRVVDASGKVHRFDQATSAVSLEKVWADLPTGRTEVWCDAYFSERHRHWTLARDFRVFWKMEPYRPGSYPKAPRGYAEAAAKCCEYLLEMPWMKTYVETGKPDPTYRLNSYPAKMDAAMIRLMVNYARIAPARRDAALKLAHAAADHLLSLAQPKDAPLAYFPPTYLGENYTAGRYKGMNMLIYPAAVGYAFVALYGETKDEKYLEAAKGIAETYMKLQGADGTWPLKAYETDGSPVSGNRLLPVAVIGFMDAIFDVVKDDRYRACGDRAFAYLEKGPLSDWNWEGQFEDVEPSGKYENLTKHPPCSVAQLLVNRWPNDAKRLAQARELLRFAEDQFVVWSRPKDRGSSDLMALLGDGWDVEPAVVEQYFYREAVDASAAKLVSTYLALYQASGNPLDLAKARTLGDAIVRIQKDNGRIQTIWSTKKGVNLQSDWVNCMASSVGALVNLAECQEK